MKTWTRLLPLLLATLVPPAAGAQPQDGAVTLAWKFRKGDPIRYEIARNLTMVWAESTGKSETLFRILLEPKEVTAEGVATLGIVFERVKVSDGEEYDSGKDKDLPKVPRDRVLACLVGARLTAKMTPQGVVTETAGMADVVDKALKDAAVDGLTADILKSSFGDMWLTILLEECLPRLTAAPVAEGGTWEVEIGEWDKVPPRKVKSTLKEVGGGEAVFSQDISQASPSRFDTPAKGQGQAIWLVGEGRLSTLKGELKGSCRLGATEITSTLTYEAKLVLPPPRGKLLK